MEASPGDLSISQRYKLLTGLIVPRPIAWISSLSPAGVRNLAPFSYFSIASHDPLAISVSVTGRKPDRTSKDTAANLMPQGQGGTGEFVVNIVTEAQTLSMAMTARPVGAGEDEFSLASLGSIPSHVVAPSRVKGAPAAFECRTIKVVEIGSARMFIGEIVHITVDEALLDDRTRIDFAQLAAVGRLAGTAYARTNDRFDLPDEGYFPSALAMGQ